jgi:glutamate-ammonia-ligase adenylyltransferase
VENLSKALLAEAQDKWEAYVVAAEAAGARPPADPEFIATAMRVFAFSNFIGKSCTRYPELLHDLIVSADLQRQYHPQEYDQKIETALLDVAVENDGALSDTLRRIRIREMVRIAWRDLSGWADLAETMTDLSAFADACLEQALARLYQRSCAEHGVPTGEDGSRQYLVILAMGKLGGRELNFSSDIDLIFAYPRVGKTEGGPASISNEEFFVRLCRQLINVIGATTSEGMVFRVDLRLRPFGESGPLIMSFDAIESYLQTQGREWERYAWIKARVAAGDKAAGSLLLERLQPFVYRRYLDFGVFEALREMKQKIAIEVKRKGMRDNVKLGPGGIREIEFFGQIFQLLRGGVTPELRQQSIQKVVKILARQKLITTDVCAELSRAYEFLRNTENRLQEFSDQQTHKLPAAPLERERLAVSLGFEHWNAFELYLRSCMQNVHAQFNALLQSKDSDEEDDQASTVKSEFKRLWLDQLEEVSGHKVLADAGFETPDEVVRMLAHLRLHPATRALSSEGKHRLDKLMPQVLNEAGLCAQPLPVLNRIVDLIKTIQQRINYLALLLENPGALTHLVKLAEASPWVISYLTRHPVLLDELLDPRSLYEPPRRQDLEKEVDRRIDRAADHDLEQQIQELCIFKQVNTLRVAAADVTGALALMKTSDHLTEIAETVLLQVLDLAWNHLVEKHGFPQCRLNGERCERGFAVIAYGKLGGIELGYDSDLDLVFLHAGTEGQTQGGTHPLDNSQFFARLGQRVIHILTARTGAGMLYEPDMRLRPSGSSGILVSHIEAFKDYQSSKAWTWEHQALVKARPISGDTHLVKRFEQIRRSVLGQPRSQPKLRKDVADMRERMRKERLRPEPGIFDLKQGKGGIVDIEFLVQYLVLLGSHRHTQLMEWTDNVRILETLIESGIIEEREAQFLREAYLTYRMALHRLSLQEKPAQVPAERFDSLHTNVQKIWDTFFAEHDTVMG